MWISWLNKQQKIYKANHEIGKYVVQDDEGVNNHDTTIKVEKYVQVQNSRTGDPNKWKLTMNTSVGKENILAKLQMKTPISKHNLMTNKLKYKSVQRKEMELNFWISNESNVWLVLLRIKFSLTFSTIPMSMNCISIT